MVQSIMTSKSRGAFLSICLAGKRSSIHEANYIDIEAIWQGLRGNKFLRQVKLHLRRDNSEVGMK